MFQRTTAWFVMEDAAFAGVGVALLLTVLLLLLRCTVITKKNAPPTKAGWIPWLGVALEFGKEPLRYIQKTRAEASCATCMIQLTASWSLWTPWSHLLQLGDVFTILAAGKRMTFMFCQTHLFFQSPQADFRAAVQPFTQRAGLLAQIRLCILKNCVCLCL